MSDGGEDQNPATGPLPPGTPGDIQPPANPISPRPFHTPSGPVKDPNRGAFIRSSLVAAVLGMGAFFLAALFASKAAAAIQPFIFLLMIATGGVAVTFYTNKVHTEITTGQGFRLGLLTGFFGGVMTIALSSFSMISQNSRAEFRKMVIDGLNSSAAASADPSAKDTAAKFAASIGTSGGLFLFLLAMMVFVLVIYLVLAGIGGAVGATLFGKTRRHDS